MNDPPAGPTPRSAKPVWPTSTPVRALLTAFYVDNTPRLPLWKRLPPLSFWFLPAVVGLPLLLRALRHRIPHRSSPAKETTTP
ncbi:hypothetical protein QMK19_08595 [Streptomyces sp. H10-C2]|uniref:hypothetical protein n=1 Tax=unclassified Streptomyces TaxID=2593676 RepID=UPI0024B90B69|nr:MULTISPECIES: hypothetical protein [unclassified Streptomyces]MDJ0341034.1 hypothetical protein [Streptomyces sp. PH10-H1]MDJ0369734.1 hypothetical protein [Streptomyces sp. H10-C2]